MPSQRYDGSPTAELSSERIDALMRDLAARPPGQGRTAARERTISLLVPLARRVARRFRAQSEDYDDLVQVASLGLVKAVDGYDPTLGHAFLSYALPTIVGEIKRHIRDHTTPVRLPRPVQEARALIFQAVAELQQRDGGRSPSPAQISENTGLEPGRVTATLRAVRECNPRYLDAQATDGEDCAIISRLGAEDRELSRVVDSVALTSAVKQLPEQDRHVLYLRFYRERTQQQIADVVGVSQMQVSRILTRCLQRLRVALASEPVPAEDRPARMCPRRTRPLRSTGPTPCSSGADRVRLPAASAPCERASTGDVLRCHRFSLPRRAGALRAARPSAKARRSRRAGSRAPGGRIPDRFRDGQPSCRPADRGGRRGARRAASPRQRGDSTVLPRPPPAFPAARRTWHDRSRAALTHELRDRPHDGQTPPALLMRMRRCGVRSRVVSSPATRKAGVPWRTHPRCRRRLATAHALRGPCGSTRSWPTASVAP
ncbi:sigma-70 family RNA polymerase sigma factor [Streptomyces beihaiensis]|uniref:Sigma-70 family RNA polymerase sigma factor n=1 Tax=Streptomyces beihaiensis TaxID=2984495 RepID=A0ABT3U1W5_9ACTN|nr:sigma-70 family RNA polymerase sigma factor [Streptomyces beihaiensis]MCX3063045.1 sigma-70 family RNA polymerase sigma factor [Streptomyces beihaiensis]